MTALNPNTSEAVRRLQANSDFALFMAWLWENQQTQIKNAIHPEKGDDDRHSAGRAYCLDQLIGNVKTIWDQKGNSQ